MYDDDGHHDAAARPQHDNMSTPQQYNEEEEDDDEVDSYSHAPNRELHYMENSISEPIEMPSWVGGRAQRTARRRPSLNFQESFSESSSTEFWNYRGQNVDPSHLKFASNEPEEEQQNTGGFRLPIFPPPAKTEKEEEEDDEPQDFNGLRETSTMDWDAFLKDVTMAPSKTEGQGLDFFFGMMNRRNHQSIAQKDSSDNNKNKPTAKGLLGTILDRASEVIPDGVSPSIASGTIETSKSDRSRTEKRFFMMHHDETSIVSDNTPSNGGMMPWSRGPSIGSSKQQLEEASSLLKNGNDCCSNGSIGSSASWNPYQDIWDQDMDVTAKRVEAERREAPRKRTGKELWQIVRDNRRVIIGKSLRIEDVILMAKRPWRKAPKPLAQRAIEPEKSEVVKEPEDVALNMEDELALVSLAPDMDRTSTPQRKKHDDDRKKKHRSKSRDSESTSTKRGRKGSSKTSSSRSSKDKSRRRSTSSDGIIGEKVSSKSRSRGHSVPRSKKEKGERRRSSSRHSKRENKHTSSKQSDASGTTTIETTASMAAALSPESLSDKHRRKTQRSDSKRTVTEYSNSSAEMSDKVMQLPSAADTSKEFRAFLNQDKEACTTKKKKKSKSRPATPSKAETTKSDVGDNQDKLRAFLVKDKAAVEEEKKKRKKKSKKASKDTESSSRRRHSTKSRKSSSNKGKDDEEKRRTTM